MKISTKARYGARALADLAAHSDAPASVRDIAARQRISPKYLEQILNALRAAGLVRAVRGLHGGYTVAKPPAAINLCDVYEAVEGSVAPVECVDHHCCPMEDVCPTRQTWLEMKETLESLLKRTTIQELVDRRIQKERAFVPMYQI